MEQELVNADNIENVEMIEELFELPPLKEMNEIISEFEKSGMADEPSIYDGIESELEIDEQPTENTYDLDLSEEEQAGIPVDSLNEEVTNIILDEKDIPEIDFEISKDIFDEIKIKEEDLPSNMNHILLDNSNLGNETISLSSERKLNGNKLPEYIERETGQHLGEKEKEECVVNEDQNIFKFNDCNSSSEESTPKLVQETANKESKENKRISEINNLIENEIHENFLNFKQGVKDIEEDELHKNVSHSKKVACEDEKENAEMLIDEEHKKVEGNIESSSKTAISSIDEVIESVVKASAELCDISDEAIDDNQAVEKNITAKKCFKMITDDSKVNDATYKKVSIKKKTHGLFEVVVPLIGKNVMESGNDKPFNQRYDLAKQTNKLRAKYQQNMPDFPIPSTSYQEWRRQKSLRSKEQIEREEQEVTLNAMQLATAFTKIAIRILHEYSKDQPNEAAMIKYFGYFECAPASPLSLLYAPHFVHTVMLCRGDADLSFKLRRVANDCYEKCHALFAIPEGYNFETVYTSEVKKNIPDEFDNLNELDLDYGDYDSSDFEDELASENEGQENWE